MIKCGKVQRQLTLMQGSICPDHTGKKKQPIYPLSRNAAKTRVQAQNP